MVYIWEESKKKATNNLEKRHQHFQATFKANALNKSKGQLVNAGCFEKGPSGDA